MTAKAAVSKGVHSTSELADLLSEWFVSPLRAHKRLFGGYSGSTYRVELTDGTVAVLKICHGYSREDVEAQARIMAHLRANGFEGACFALPRLKRADGAVKAVAAPMYTAQARDGSPSCVLTYVEGESAARMIDSGGAEVETVLAAVGAGLARLHQVNVTNDNTALRNFTQGGACSLQRQLSGEFAASLRTSEHVNGEEPHPFISFYEEQLTGLREAINVPNLPLGVLHGDPFLDNAHFCPATGRTPTPLLEVVACTEPRLCAGTSASAATCAPGLLIAAAALFSLRRGRVRSSFATLEANPLNPFRNRFAFWLGRLRGCMHRTATL